MTHEEKLIIALDLPKDQVASFICKIPKGPIFKIGMRLFTSSGPEVVRNVLEKGHKVFLDMKFMDIPNTVAEASESAFELGVTMFNVHALGGPTMIKNARAKLDEIAQKTGKKPPILLGVTVLTSMDEAEMCQIGLPGKPAEMVTRLTELALKNGCDGVVCSAQEVATLRKNFGEEFVAVTPGIRREKDATGDQKRVATPSSAIGDGATCIVVGRPILSATDPAAEAAEFIKEIQNAKRNI